MRKIKFRKENIQEKVGVALTKKIMEMCPTDPVM